MTEPQETTNVTESRDLKRQLGFLSVFGIAAGAMISSGLFVLPGLAYAEAGPAVILSYAVASVLMIPFLFSGAELATAMPRSGGSYFFIERSLGPLVGTVAGLANWLSIALKAAFALVGIGALTTLILPGPGIWTIRIVALIACAFFAIVNTVSIKQTGRLQVGLLFALLAIVLFYCLKSVSTPVMDLTRVHGPEQPFMPEGWQSVFAVAGMVFISFGGLTKVSAVAEEVRRPARNITLGMFVAFGVVTVLYVFAVFVTVSVVNGSELSASLAPLSLGASKAIGPWGTVLVSVAALFAFATTANAGILAASRTPMAMSRDGLAPAFLSKTNRRFGSPHVAIVVTTGFIMAVIAFLSLKDLVKTASTMMLLLFMLQDVSLIIMRYSGLKNYRPTFKTPLVPWLQIVAITACGFLILEMGTLPLLLSGLFILLATLWYVFYVNPRVDRESAFVYMVKRIISKDFSDRGLEDELKSITLERDEIELDRFDKLVNHAIVLDIEASLSARDLFHRISRALSSRIGIDEKRLFELFLERERDTSTVVRPGLAIPHVVVEGEHVFELMLVRCKRGAIFSDLHPPVTTAFVLVGSQDERNYHLRALMAIAHIVEESEFEKRWKAASDTAALRDVIVLSRRSRQT